MSLNLGIIASSRSSAPSAALLLDTYSGAAAAYSLRKLRSAYSGSAIRVRRSIDNTETDIGFVGSGGLDTTTLTTFCGAGNGYVSKWYDQSGNLNDLIQNTLAEQGIIFLTGSLIVSNGKPAIQGSFPSASSWNLTTPLSSNTDYSQFFVTNSSTGNSISFASSTTYFPISGIAADSSKLFYFSNRAKYGTFPYTGSKFLFSFFSISLNLTGFLNGVSKTVTSTTNAVTGDYTLFGKTIFDSGRSFWIENIFYANNQTANNSGINANINSFYSIY